MEEKKSKSRKTVLPAADSFSGCEATGWMFKLSNEGWLRKRWRRRFCVLSSGILYSYEHQNADGSEKTCSTIQLKLFKDCLKAPRKECKKSPNTFVLEPIKQQNGGDESKRNSIQIPREFFHTESRADLENWITKLKESISLSNIGRDSKLNHVTKSRPRPPKGSKGNRRPPSKHHLKEMAMISEVMTEERDSTKELSKTRGNMPTFALKPPVITSSDSTNTPSGGKKAKQPLEDEQRPSQVLPNPPPSALKPRLKKKEIETKEEKETLQISKEVQEMQRDGEAVVSTSTDVSPRKKPSMSSQSRNFLSKKNSAVMKLENIKDTDSDVMLQTIHDSGSNSNVSIEKRAHDDQLIEASWSEDNTSIVPASRVFRHRQHGQDCKGIKFPEKGRARSMIIVRSHSPNDEQLGKFSNTKEAVLEEEIKRKKYLKTRPSSLVIYSN